MRGVVARATVLLVTMGLTPALVVVPPVSAGAIAMGIDTGSTSYGVGKVGGEVGLAFVPGTAALKAVKGATLARGAVSVRAANAGSDVVRHYATREAAEAITKGGSIEPGAASGKIWLTPDRYASGAEARSKLALNKTPDGYFETPMCRVRCPSAPGKVDPYYNQPGGGIEITTEFPINIRGLIFRGFE